MTLRVSTIYWHSWLANDFRDAINPHIPAPLSSADHFAGVDPALEAALSYTAPPTLGEHTEETLAELGYDDDAIERLLAAGTIGVSR